MTQTIRDTEKKNEKGYFTQVPLIIIDHPDLSSLERWLAVVLIRLCWSDPTGWHEFSLREISQASGVSAGYLCPTTGKITREGMLYKLERLACISIKRGDGKHPSYFIQIAPSLWTQNSVYSESVYSVNSKRRGKGVYSVNSDVYPVDTSVYQVNNTVYSVNKSVYSVNSDTSSTLDVKHAQDTLYNIDTNRNKEKIEKDTSSSQQAAASYSQEDYVPEETFPVLPGELGVNGYRKGQENDETTARTLPDMELSAPVEQGVGASAVTHKTPPLQVMSPVLNGDAREEGIHPPNVPPLLQLTTRYEVDVLVEDAWDGLPGQMTGESIFRTDDTSQEVAASTSTNDGLQDSTTQPASQQKTVQTGGNKKVGPPVMPEDTALWNAEALVQVCEAYRGRRYPNGAKKKSDRIRDTELIAAQTLLTEASDIWTEDTAENRENLLKIIKHVQNRKGKWWLNNVEGGYVNPHHLVDKDRIHAMWDELHLSHRSTGTSTPPNSIRKPPPIDDLPYFTQEMYDNLRTRGAAYV